MEFKDIFQWVLFAHFINMVMAREMYFLRLHNNVSFMKLENWLWKETNEHLFIHDRNGGLKEKCPP